MSLIQQLNIIFHNLLWSRYKFLIIFIFYISYIYINNSNNIVLCEENQQNSINNPNSINTNNKLIGSALFIGSIIIILFLKSYSSTDSGSDIDVSSIIDQGANLVTQSVLSTSSPELLDIFTLDANGNLINEDILLNTNNVYLNADQVKHFIELNKLNSVNLIQPIKDWYIVNNIPITENVPTDFVQKHIQVLDMLCSKGNEQMILNAQHSNFIIALEKTGILDSQLFNIYANYLQNNGDPTKFDQFLTQHLRK